MRITRWPYAALVMVGMSIAPVAQAAATVVIVNLDGPGEGLNDPTPVSPVGGNAGITLGAQRLIALQHAAQIWGQVLNSDVAIRLGVDFDVLPCSPASVTLGGAGANTVHRDFTSAPRALTWYPAALANKIAGIDLAPVDDDMGATFSSVLGEPSCPFPASWYFGLDAAPPGQDIDFVTVVLHEIGHGLGFQTFVNLGTGQRFLGFDDAYMVHLENHATGATYPDMTDFERVVASTADGNLHWTGPSVVAGSSVLTAGADVNGHVEMYAPPTQAPGSSVSHFSTSLTPNELMEPSFTVPLHTVGLARSLMSDIGWGGAIFCDWDTDKTTYSGAEIITATHYRFANLGATFVAVEVKGWLEVPGGTLSITNLGADNTLVLAPGHDQDFGPFPMGSASALPLGEYELGCRMLDPVTGETLGVDTRKFTIE